MQRLEVSGAVRLIYMTLGVKGLKCHQKRLWTHNQDWKERGDFEEVIFGLQQCM